MAQLLHPRAPHEEGDIWKLPNENCPMWTDQYAYQGSAKSPYIVSCKNPGRANGSTTPDGWACSCMNFTRHTPRTPCKHILNVRLKFGIAWTSAQPSAKMANVDAMKLAAFEKWQREQAASKKSEPAGSAKLALFGETSRKFR